MSDPRYCDDCGEAVYNGRCTNCHENLFILDQYHELDMAPPAENTDFMKKCREQQEAIEERKRNLEY